MGILKQNNDDVVNLKPYLRREKEKSLQPDWTKAKMRVYVSNAFAGGYELELRLPVPTDFIRDKKKDNRGEFVRQLHNFINENTGKWLGAPSIGGLNDRPKNGMLDIRAVWHFDDAYFAYALGLDLSAWCGNNEVVEKGQIANRMHLVEKAFRELQGYRDLATKKLMLRTQDKEERNRIWKEEFLSDWIKLTDKWKERGISYVPLSQSSAI